jgi:hypothetical protein
MHACMHACMYVCMYACVRACVRALACVHTGTSCVDLCWVAALRCAALRRDAHRRTLPVCVLVSAAPKPVATERTPPGAAPAVKRNRGPAAHAALKAASKSDDSVVGAVGGRPAAGIRSDLCAAHTCARTHAHARRATRAQDPIHTFTHTRARANAHANARTHARTHMRTRTLACRRRGACGGGSDAAERKPRGSEGGVGLGVRLIEQYAVVNAVNAACCVLHVARMYISRCRAWCAVHVARWVLVRGTSHA